MMCKIQSISEKIVNCFFKSSKLNYFIIFYCSYMVCCPPYFTTYVSGYIKTPLRLLGILFILFLYFFNVIYKQRISKLFVSAFIACLYFFIICVLNKNDYYYALYSNFIMALSSIALFEIYMNSNLKKEFILINYYSWMVSIFIFVAVFLIGGLDSLMNIYNRNNYVMFFIMYILFEKQLLLIDDKKSYKIVSYIMSIVIVLFSIITEAATASVVLIMIYAYIYLFDKIDLYKKLFSNFNIYLTVLIVFFFLLIFPGSHSPLVNIISKLFNKVAGFSGRSGWYDIDREIFLRRPIFGYGSRQYYNSLLGTFHASPHDFVFQYLIDGGIVGFALLVYCYKIVIETIKRKGNLNLVCYLLMVLFAFTLRNFFEAIGLNYVFFVLANIYFMYMTYDDDYISIKIV